MKTARRHELQTNELAEWLGANVERIRPYTKLIVAAIVAAVVLLTAYWYLSEQSRAKAQEGWDKYFTARADGDVAAISQLFSEYAGTPVEFAARLFLGDRQLATGVEGLFQGRPDSQDLIRGAAENYQRVRDNVYDPLVWQRATFGLARALEAMPDRLADAEAQYKLLVERAPNGVYTPIARKRLAELARTPVREFHDWFVQQSRAAATDEGPEVKPTFESDALPDRTDFPLPESPAPGDAPSSETPAEQDAAGREPLTSAPEDEAQQSAPAEPGPTAPDASPGSPETESAGGDPARDPADSP